MLEQVKNLIAYKEITRRPKRTLPTISFCLVPYDIEILMTFQRNSNSYRSPSRTDQSCSDMMIILRRSCSYIFVKTRNELIKMPEGCKLLNDLLILIFCFLASITVTISSEVPSPGKRRHYILLFEELSPQISSFDMIFESTSHFFNCHRWMF